MNALLRWLLWPTSCSSVIGSQIFARTLVEIQIWRACAPISGQQVRLRTFFPYTMEKRWKIAPTLRDRTNCFPLLLAPNFHFAGPPTGPSTRKPLAIVRKASRALYLACSLTRQPF